MEKDYKQEFFRWLKNKGLFYSYIINVKNDWSRNNGYDGITSYYMAMRIKQLMEDREPKHLIDRSFYWEETNEGHNFWSDLDDEWNDYCDENLGW